MCSCVIVCRERREMQGKEGVRRVRSMQLCPSSSVSSRMGFEKPRGGHARTTAKAFYKNKTPPS